MTLRRRVYLIEAEAPDHDRRLPGARETQNRHVHLTARRCILSGIPPASFTPFRNHLCAAISGSCSFL
jgi:hypothetical protein